MLSSELFHFWKWRLFFIGVTLLVTGFIFLKIGSQHIVLDQGSLFNLSKPKNSSSKIPFYHEEIIDPIATYRMAHVASMTELPDRTLVATWYAGSGELKPDVKIYLSKKNPTASNWSDPEAIVTREQASKDLQRYIKGIGNAVVFSGANGVLYLLYVTVSLGKWSGSQLNLTSSYDAGKTWGKSQHLLLSPFFNWSELVKNAPIRLVNGGWVIPIYQEFLGKFPELLWLQPDDKKGLLLTKKSRIAGGCSCFQPSMTVLTPKTAIVFCRDYQTSEKIWRMQTVDGGISWSSPEPINLPNHDSGIASLRLSCGDLLLAFNDTATSARNILRLAISNDDGKTWKRIATIAEDSQGDFSYPYFFVSHDGTIHLLYSWQRHQIHHLVFNEAWVETAGK